MLTFVIAIAVGLFCALGYIWTRWHVALGEQKQLRALVFNYFDFAPTCNPVTGECWICESQWYPNECAPDCLALLMWQAIHEADEAASLWLDLLDDKEQAEEKLVAAIVRAENWEHIADRLAGESIAAKNLLAIADAKLRECKGE